MRKKPKTWSCKNCRYFKQHTVGREDLKRVSKQKLQKSVREGHTRMLDLEFPINYGIFKKVRKLGRLKIAYCAQNLFKRCAYEFKKGFLKGSVTTRRSPCPKYK